MSWTGCGRKGSNSGLSWTGFKERLPPALEQRRRLIQPHHRRLSIRRQCRLVRIAPSSYYYHAKPEGGEERLLRRLLAQEHRHHPFYGVRKLTHWLRRKGFPVNVKRVRRLVRSMGLRTVYPPPRSSPASADQNACLVSRKRKADQFLPETIYPRGIWQGEFLEQRFYPYLLRDLNIERPNQVWATDLTTIPIACGFAYLMVIMDWFSRFVVAWGLARQLDPWFCLTVLHRALARATPEIINTDHGLAFTNELFQAPLLSAGVAISTDGKRGSLDNLLMERLWWSVKYEEAYLNDYADAEAAENGLRGYFHFYDHERLHQALGYRTPAELYLPPSH